MISRILLLASLTCRVCGSFDVRAAQSFYDAEENENITLEWTFPAETDSSLHSLSIYCAMHRGNEHPCVFRLNHGLEVRRSQHQQFSGRVRCDKKILKEGRLRLHLSSLRWSDSGRYKCEVVTNSGADTGNCLLSVTARAQSQMEGQVVAVIKSRNIRGQSGLFIGLALLLAVPLVWLLVKRLKSCCFPKNAQGI